MKSFLLLYFLACTLLLSCTGYSHYPIDEDPKIKNDSSLLGVWKCTTDTNSNNFVLVNTYYKAFDDIIKAVGSAEKYAADAEPDYQPYFSKELNTTGYNYYLTYYSESGSFPKYWNSRGYFSVIGNTHFLNVRFWRFATDEKGNFTGEVGGFAYLLLKVLYKSTDTIAVAAVSNPKMKNQTTSEEVKALIKRNLDYEPFYQEPLKFYKVKTADFTAKEVKDMMK